MSDYIIYDFSDMIEYNKSTDRTNR